MNEEFLHFIWRNRLFDHDNLVSSTGEKIEILNIGQPNSHAGPDFFNAQIKIENTVWAGNVEIHLKTSDWKRHNHQKDQAYNNVILHVVAIDDAGILNSNGEKITTMILHFEKDLLKKYEDLLLQQLWIPCQNLINSVDSFTVNFWLDSLLVERLEQKTGKLMSFLTETKNDWEEVFYRQIARCFGYKINAEPFELLARSLPYKYLAKHSDNQVSIEAMIFGQAGLLNADIDNDDYFNILKREYSFFRKKFSLIPIDNYLWKYLRLRPSNFPTIRLAQFVNLIFRTRNLFSGMIECTSIEDVKNLFNDLGTSEYWEDHYVFGKKSTLRKKIPGNNFIDLLLINAVVPVMFSYGKIQDNDELVNLSLKFLEDLPPEDNSIIKGWDKLGIKPENAFYSQALIELKNEYCSRKNCLRCSIGGKLIISNKIYSNTPRITT